MTLAQKIEAILFYRNEPTQIKYLAKTLASSPEDIEKALHDLNNLLKDHSITLVNTGEEVSLNTSLESKDLIEQIAKEELDKDLGKAGVETLTIIAYNGRISKRDIDYVRGVDSGFMLRHLLVRGLIDRESAKEGRSFFYKPSIELLRFLGISSLSELPNKEEFERKIKKTIEERENKQEI